MEQEEVVRILVALKEEHWRMARGWQRRPGEVPKKRADRELQKVKALEAAIFICRGE